jgi:anti-anti-sigma factor
MTTVANPIAVRRAGGAAVLDLPEQIDGTTQERLDAAYEEATRADGRRIVLNFTAVKYVNSTGIALLVGTLARAMRENRRLAAYGLSDHYREIFEVTRLADFIAVFPDESAALAAE